MPKYDWDTFISDFKRLIRYSRKTQTQSVKMGVIWEFIFSIKKFLPPQYLIALEDDLGEFNQKGMPVLSYSNKLLTLA